MPKIGQPLNLSLQLFDGATNKFCQARLFNPDGTAMSGSPVNLTHASGGLYLNSALSMPNQTSILVQYKVFDDSGHTTPSATHSDAEERFDLNTATQSVDIIGYIEDPGFIES